MNQLNDLIKAAGQSHLIELLGRLEGDARRSFEEELGRIDWRLVPELTAAMTAPKDVAPPALEPAPTIVKGRDTAADDRARNRGEELLESGRVAVFVVAGGQGSRLGFEGPKGLYPATPIRRASLFALFSEKVRALGRRFGKTPPWYIMTSSSNHAATIEYFGREDYFGLGAENVRFFSQDMLPAVDERGRILLEGPGRLFLSPNGHGGSLLALSKSGALVDMRRRGIQQIFYFQVDNPLVMLADPVFMGYHDLEEAEMSSKVVPKRDAHEKVGVLGLIDKKFGVIEYSDLSAAEREAKDDAGNLRFSAGNIAIHAFRRDFVERITEGGLHLPYHLAKKSIPCIDPVTMGKQSVPGVKFETFVFDALGLCRRSVVLEVNRAEEFAPIKNAAGEDSPESSTAAQSALFAAWLERLGCKVPRDPGGQPLQRIEISPLVADDFESLKRTGIEPRVVDFDWLIS